MMFRSGSWHYSVEERLDGIEVLQSDIATRLQTLENADLITRVNALETWRANKASSIADVTTTASAASVTILGISVPTNSSYTALVDAHNGLKDKMNSVLAALRFREIINA